MSRCAPVPSLRSAPLCRLHGLTPGGHLSGKVTSSIGVVGQSTMSAGPKKGAGQPTTHQHPSEFNLLWLYRHGYRTSPFRFSSNRLLISATSARGRWLGGGAEASERRHTLGHAFCQSIQYMSSVLSFHVVVPRGGYI